MKTQSLVRRVAPFLMAAAALILVAAPASALEKVGTTSMQTLRIPMGVRGIGMGNAMAAASRDVESVWWNPGALTEMQSTQALFSHINMPADIQLNSFVVGGRWGDYSAVSLHGIGLVTDDMPVRTYDMPRGTGENFNASDVVLGLSYARKLTDKFSLGGNVRYLRSALENSTYNGVSVDLGTLYKTGLRGLRLGMAIQNLGPDVQYSGSFLDYRNQIQNENNLFEEQYEGAAIPTMFRLGISFNIFEMLAVDMDTTYSSEFAVEMNHPNDNRERLNVGAEIGYNNLLFLRAGGKFAYDEESFALGLGLKIPVFDQYRVRFDAAYSHMGRFSEAAEDFMDQPLRGSLGLEF